MKLFTLLILLVFLTGTATASSVQTQAHEKGYPIGYKTGVSKGKQDCLKYGKTSVLVKIPNAPTVHFKNGVSNYIKVVYLAEYKKAFKSGFLVGYHSVRFGCLKGK